MNISKFTIQKSFAINAGAGSGKTYALSRRYINALLGFDFFREKGFDELYYDSLKLASTKEIVTITYTEAAALEMKERIFGLISKILSFDMLNEKDGDKSSIEAALSDLSAEQKEYVMQTLQRALIESSDAKISTIHSFCLDILRTNADIARFDANIEIVKEDEKSQMIDEAIFLTLNDPKNASDVEELTQYLNLYFLNTIFQKYATSSTFRSSFDAFDENSLDEDILKAIIRDLYPLPDKTPLEAEISDDEQRFDWLDKYYENFYNFNAVAWKDVKDEKAPSLGVKKYSQLDAAKKYMDSIVGIYANIDDIREILFYKKISLLKGLMKQIKAMYDRTLHEAGKLDFDEIIFKTHQLIKDVKSNIKYMMVDEFQDTNSVQYEIIKGMLNENTNLFVVGDNKQSIYSFQGAEIEVFNDAIEDRTYLSSVEPMDVNFRSDGVVLEYINKIFANILKADDRLKLLKQNYEASPQALHVSSAEKEDKGSFHFLINPIDNASKQEEGSEYAQIAKFIANIKCGKLPEYQHIREKIDKNEKAIAVVFDASTKMLELKHYLGIYNIECKVSASENFYHTKEINDISNILMAMQQPNNRFYKTAALRSSLLQYSDDEIYHIISENKEVKELSELKKLFEVMALSEFIVHIYQEYSFMEIWNYYEDSEQKRANLDKFLFKALEFESSNGNDIYTFLKMIENNIYFSNAKEDEAFFKSDNLESIELCTIHSTKGLAYPMVIVANCEKNINTQIQSDTIKYNSFSLAKDSTTKLVTGFKINGYEPLTFRVLKEIDKKKHLAEKKRLLYVALTRAEHDVVISASIKNTKTNGINVSDTSYLGLIIKGLGYNAKMLYENNYEESIKGFEDIVVEQEKKKITNETVILEPLNFEQYQKPRSATNNTQEDTVSTAARYGTVIHKIIELYWDKLADIDHTLLYEKYNINDIIEQKKISASIERFLHLLKDFYKAMCMKS